jgi:Fuc2NAc and GlcNAc transferase
MLILFLLLLLLAFVLTYCMRLYALKTNIIDNPNERSSHSVPTPRGGGIAVVLSYLLGLVVLSYFNLISIHIGFTVILAGSVIALLGFLDDRGHINSMLRLAVHFLMAIGVVVSLNGFSGVTIFNGVQLGFIANIIAVLFLVWLLNLYNFMDGINGIASIEAITATVSMAVLYIVLNESINSNPLWSLAACVLGFLFRHFVANYHLQTRWSSIHLTTKPLQQQISHAHPRLKLIMYSLYAFSVFPASKNRASKTRGI